jgi:hypothetical protein
LSPDLRRGNAAGVKKFLKQINDGGLVKGGLTGGGLIYNKPMAFRVEYFLKNSPPAS